MDLMAMIRNGEISIMAIVPMFLLIEAIAVGMLCYLLAKSKNRNKKAAIIFGIIPMINILAVLYYVGVPKLEAKIA